MQGMSHRVNKTTNTGRAFVASRSQGRDLHSGHGAHANSESHTDPLVALEAHQVMQSREMTTPTQNQKSPRTSETW